MRKGTVAKDNDGSRAMLCWQSVFHASGGDRSSTDGLLALMMLFSCCVSLSLSLSMFAQRSVFNHGKIWDTLTDLRHVQKDKKSGIHLYEDVAKLQGLLTSPEHSNLESQASNLEPDAKPQILNSQRLTTRTEPANTFNPRPLNLIMSTPPPPPFPCRVARKDP